MFANSVSMLGRIACGVTAAIAVLAFEPAAPAQAAEEPLYAVLNGENECDNTAPPAGPVCRQGDPRGYGTATILIVSGSSLCFGLAVDNFIAPATAAHIHRGEATVNGPIVVNLAPPVAPNASNPGASSGCINNVPANIISDILANPTRFYVNVHSGQFPAGAVRGQLF